MWKFKLKLWAFIENSNLCRSQKLLIFILNFIKNHISEILTEDHLSLLIESDARLFLGVIATH